MKKFLIIGSIAACFVNTLTFAGNVESGKKGNGGQTIMIDGKHRLKDLVDSRVGKWDSGSSYLKNNTDLKKTLEKLAKIDWYFALSLKNEIAHLNFYETDELFKVSTKDLCHLVKEEKEKTYQKGVRVFNEVLVNKNIELSEHDFAFFVIHEALHSFVSHDDCMYYLRLESVVKTLENVFDGTLTDSRSLYEQMHLNGVLFPQYTLPYLDGYREALMFILGDADDRKSVLLKTFSVDKLFDEIRDLPVNYLYAPDRLYLHTASIETAVYSAIQNEDTDVLDVMLNTKAENASVVLAILYSSPLVEQSATLKKYVSDKEKSGELVSSLLSDLSNVELSLNDNDRLVVNHSILLSSNRSSNESTPFTELNSLDEMNPISAAPKVRLFFQVITKLIKQNDNEALDRLCYSNPNFYSAFGTLALSEKISQFSFPYPHEKDVALLKVKTLTTGMWSVLREYIISANGRKKWSAFKSHMATKKLGIELY
jgi:hypothetical protein